MRTGSVTLFLVFCTTLFLTPLAAAQMRLTYSNFFPPTHIHSQLAERWCKEIEKQTNGEIVFNYFPASTLTRPQQTYIAVAKGVADIGMTAIAYSRGRFPVLEAIDLPMGYTSGVQATAVANQVLERFDPEELHNTEVMYLHAHGPGLIHTRNKPIHTLEDLKGLKIRGTGTSGEVIAALGGTPVGQSMAETYQMLQRGVVDGSAHPVEANNGWKLGEVARYMIQNFSSGYTTTFAVFMNQKRWRQLTLEQQEIITRINEEFALKHGQAWDEADEKGMAFFLSKGGTVISQTDEESRRWAEKVSVLIQDYIQNVAKRGIDGKPIVDFIQAKTARP